ncbi:MAG: hypothetical protein RIF33_08480 [Cyclobacteriaceae bacterium]
MIFRFSKYFLVAALAIYISSCGSDDSMDTTPVPQVDCSTLAISMTSSTNAGCTSLGSVEVSATGGMSPYTFAIDGGASQSTGTFSELSAGSYSISAKDANDCTVTLNVTIDEDANTLSISASQIEAAGCGTEAGEIEVTVGNGTGNIEYSLNGGAFSSDAVFTGLAADTYEITARNEEGCETTASAQVLTGITLSGHVQNIVDTNCAIPACHGGSQAPDFREKAIILSIATNIANRTANGSMPPSGALDQELIDTIACWVEDGALDN